jgi:hypothetical protein
VDYANIFFNFGFPAGFCLVMFWRGCKSMDKLAGVISRLEITQARLLTKLDEQETKSVNITAT